MTRGANVLKVAAIHLGVFLIGAVGIGVYFAQKISALPPKDALAGIALLPVAVVYIGAFAMVCTISLVVFLLVSYRKRKRVKVIS